MLRGKKEVEESVFGISFVPIIVKSAKSLAYNVIELKLSFIGESLAKMTGLDTTVSFIEKDVPLAVARDSRERALARRDKVEKEWTYK